MAFQFILLAEEYGRKGLTRERYFGERKNILEIFDDFALIKKFRLPRASIMEIIELCRPFLERRTNRNQALTVHTQVLAALRFFAKGTFQDDSGELVGISQPSASRAVRDISTILSANISSFVHFPDSEIEFQKNKIDFAQLHGFPNVINLIDGTHVFTLAGAGNEEPLYVCRKGGHSINVQLTCNPDMTFTSVVAKWPGSTHDSFIWKNCDLRTKFIADPPNGWLLGDSGYAIEPWLLTPLENPTSVKGIAFNKSFKKTRFKVENAIGLWKSVFRCVDKSGGKLLYRPSKTCKIICATIALHNIRRKLKLPQDEAFTLVGEPEDPICPPNLEDNALTVAGNAARRRIVQNYF